jgi:hypothetical protein
MMASCSLDAIWVAEALKVAWAFWLATVRTCQAPMTEAKEPSTISAAAVRDQTKRDRLTWSSRMILVESATEGSLLVGVWIVSSSPPAGGSRSDAAPSERHGGMLKTAATMRTMRTT